MSDDRHISLEELATGAGIRLTHPDGRPVVCVQGLGFVGAAMAIAVASARTPAGEPAFTVVGVDLGDEAGRARIGALNEGRFPFDTTDSLLVESLTRAHETGNLVCCSDDRAYALASVVVIDVPLDIDWQRPDPELRLGGFEAAVATVARRVQPGALVLLETTVPPGTTERVVVPVVERELTARGLDPSSVLVAHSYERVMPGADYLNSIINYWRVFAGTDETAGDAAEAFLRTVINTEDYPLTRLSSPTASETAKVLENTFRATTISLMEEWGRFAETVGIDLFEVVDAIRLRPTHANMRTPGFGVGGYCLTKDPLFASLGARHLFDTPVEFPVSTAAVRINQDAPLVSLDRVRRMLGGSLAGRRVLLAGVSYRQDVGDTRYSPSEVFVRGAVAEGATVVASDPLLDHWDELDAPVLRELPDPVGFDAVVFAVPHAEYRSVRPADWLAAALAAGTPPVVFDGFSVLSTEQRNEFIDAGCPVACIGRGTPEKH